jgi:hypothetical protein
MWQDPHATDSQGPEYCFSKAVSPETRMQPRHVSRVGGSAAAPAPAHRTDAPVGDQLAQVMDVGAMRPAVTLQRLRDPRAGQAGANKAAIAFPTG